jgi:regulator of cell morphogenesis and NO signaling
MITKNNLIRDDSFVTDIVLQDYRTSGVFRKHGIDYCCGGKLPLNVVCEMRGLDTTAIRQELLDSKRDFRLSSSTDFASWSIDFLVDYIIHVHHAYLRNDFPDIIESLRRFVDGHSSKYPELPGLMKAVVDLRDHLFVLLEQEEKVIFPYIRQIAHAHNNNEPYAALFVRTLRKPIENLVSHEEGEILRYLNLIKLLTNQYTPPANACISHRVSFAQLEELDNDLIQHIHLESNILFPKAIAMEKDMLRLT